MQSITHADFTKEQALTMRDFRYKNRYVVMGFTAILYTPNPGGFWSRVHGGDARYCPELIYLVLSNTPTHCIREHARKKYNYIACPRWELLVEWVKTDTLYTVHSVDGAETIRVESDPQTAWILA